MLQYADYLKSEVSHSVELMIELGELYAEAGRDDQAIEMLERSGAEVVSFEVDRCERALMEVDDEKAQLAYAHALAEYADAGGYDIEVVWDTCCTAALGIGFDKAKYRALRSLSGGEQTRHHARSCQRRREP